MSTKKISDSDEGHGEEGIITLHQGTGHVPYPATPPAPPPPSIAHAHLREAVR